jgi:hypothetical protein
VKVRISGIHNSDSEHVEKHYVQFGFRTRITSSALRMRQIGSRRYTSSIIGQTVTATERMKQNPTVFSDTLPKYFSQKYVVANHMITVRISVRGFIAKKLSNLCAKSSIVVYAHRL